MALTLASLDGKRVAVQMQVQGRDVSLSGNARYSNGQLEIDVADPAGNFTILLNDATWAGSIHRDAAGGHTILLAPKT